MPWKRVVGIALIVCVSAIWLSSSFIVKDLENNAATSPFVITYLANALFVLLLPLAYLQRYFCRQQTQSTALQTDWQLLGTAAIIAPFLWLGQFTFNVSLQFTSVSSNTILSSTGSLFTFVLALIFTKERFYWYKLFSLLACCAGTVMVALTDTDGNDHNENPFLGNCLTVVSAMLYACYAVMMSKWVPDSNIADMFLFFGFMGVVNLIIFSFAGSVLIVFHLIKYQFTLYSTLMILAKGVLDNVLSDVLWMKSVLLIGPTVSTVGLSLQWPIAIIIDAIFFRPPWMHTAEPTLFVVTGSFLIFVGFVGINIPNEVFTNMMSYKKLSQVDDLSEEIKIMQKV